MLLSTKSSFSTILLSPCEEEVNNANYTYYI